MFIGLGCLSSCDDPPFDRDYPLYLENNSSFELAVFSNDDGQFNAVYPDTSFAEASIERSALAFIAPGERVAIAGGGTTWESNYNTSVPNDTFSWFILDQDTLSRYSIRQVAQNYNILLRYDFSLEDLEKINFVIPYPPDRSVSSVKKWPSQ